ncbi:MAG: HIT domain-containing protein [Candidatus Zixiibacteriota bacterium]
MADKTIWAPWRAAFVLGKKEKGCIFCKRLKMADSARNLIIYRGRLAFVILNKYPYNAGHTMVVPKRHVGQIELLTEDEGAELFELTRRIVAVIKKALGPDSLNLGMNLGRGSGAGIPGHCHMHIVPRWRGDTNFMPVIGDTKIISLPLGPVYDALRKGCAKW